MFESLIFTLTQPVVLVAGAACIGVSAFFAGMFLGKRDKKRGKQQTTPARVEAPASRAVGELEVLEALSVLNLPNETVRMLSAQIQTAEQLTSTVSMLQGGAFRTAEKQMLPLSMKFAERAATDKATQALLGKVAIMAQFAAPSNVVHPAFASIANELRSSRKLLIEPMRELVRSLETSIQSGPWVSDQKKREGLAQDRMHDLADSEYFSIRNYGYSNNSSAWVHTWDAVEPSESGMVKVLRNTSYCQMGDVKSELQVAQFDPSVNEEELHFWIAVAKHQISGLVGSNLEHGLSCYGNLLSWTRFLESLTAKLPEQVAVTAVDEQSLKMQPIEVEQLLQVPVLIPVAQA